MPLAARRRLRVRPGRRCGAAIYFAALGLGFLFLEIFLIERASFYLNDRTAGFALVLTGMLIFSGLGAMASARLAAIRAGLPAIAVGVVVAWCALMLMALQPLLLATLGLPAWARAGRGAGAVRAGRVRARAAVPARAGAVAEGPMLPWAWALNGAFSVVATPLANLIAREQGFRRVLLLALMLYALAVITFPGQRKTLPWPNASPR